MTIPARIFIGVLYIILVTTVFKFGDILIGKTPSHHFGKAPFARAAACSHVVSAPKARGTLLRFVAKTHKFLGCMYPPPAVALFYADKRPGMAAGRC